METQQDSGFVVTKGKIRINNINYLQRCCKNRDIKAHEGNMKGKNRPKYNRPLIFSAFGKEKMGRIEILFLSSEFATFF
jgi:hypothetical protein